jgi:hypothetical protein
MLDEGMKSILKFGFPLNYSGPRSPITSKNLKSVADMPELTKQKNSKELTMGRIAGPFSVWVVSVALGAFVNEPAIFSIHVSTTPFVIAPASTDPLFGHVRAEIPVLY